MHEEFSIELKDCWFYSFHGLYEEERKTGGEFLVDVIVKTDSAGVINSIDETINYSSVYKIVKTEMNQPRDLLETLTRSIAEKIHDTFPAVKQIEVCITKKNPPIKSYSGKVAVRYGVSY